MNKLIVGNNIKSKWNTYIHSIQEATHLVTSFFQISYWKQREKIQKPLISMIKKMAVKRIQMLPMQQ